MLDDMKDFNSDALRKLILANSTGHAENSVSYIFTCPHPNCGRARKFYVRKKDGRSICFRCSEENRFKGDATWALYHLFNIPRSESAAQVYGEEVFANGSHLEYEIIDFYGDDEDDEEIIVLLPRRQWPLDTFEILDERSEKARNYLLRRGISPELADKYDVRWDPTSQRVLFPVMTNGVLRGWQGRFIHETKSIDERGRIWEIPKILSTDGLAGKSLFMFQDNIASSPHVVLCEGPFDAIKADSIGGNVASMGKGVSDKQIEILLESSAKRIYLALDRDADTDTMRIVEKLSESKEVYELAIPDHREDLGACTLEEAFLAFQNASPIRPSKLLLHVELPAWMRAT